MQTSQPHPQLRLIEQLTEARFPSGVRSPSFVLFLALLLLAGGTAAMLRTTEPAHVPEAQHESQRELARNVARSIAISARQSAADLRTATDLASGAPAQLAKAVLASHPRWRGIAVLDGASRKVLASGGETIPTASLPPELDGTVRPVLLPGGGVRMMVAVTLSGAGRDKQVVAALSSARLIGGPVDPDLRQGLLLTTGSGTVIDFQGAVPTSGDTSTRGLISRAVTAAGTGQDGTVVGAAAAADKRAAVVAYAPVSADGLAGSLGLTVLSVVHAPLAPAETTWRGLVPAAGLVGIAVLGFALLRAAVVAPVRRLRAGSIAVAAGRLRARVGPFRASEVRRIAAAIDHCRLVLRGGPTAGQPTRRGPSAGLAVLIVSGGVLGWSAAMAATLGQEEVAVPASVVAVTRSQVGNTTEVLRRSLNDGVADLRAVAALGTGKDTDALTPALERLATTQSRYRAVYLVDERGDVTLRAGRDPLRAPTPPPKAEGVTQLNTSGRVPILFAHTPMPGGRALLGEFDLDHLARLLDRAPGKVRVLDKGSRTLIANFGYRAFEKPADPALRRSAATSLAGKSVADVTEVNGQRAVLIARPLGGRGAAAGLGWAVVAAQPVDTLDLAGNEVRRDALLVTLIGVVLALLLFGWHHFVVIRPLRRVAAAADALLGGDTRTVVYPQRQDEIGTIACCLEICRQALVDGAERLGEVRRPAGAATDPTILMQRLPMDSELVRTRPDYRRPVS